VLVGGPPHAEVDVRLSQLRLAARADRADGGAFGHGCTAPDHEGAEMDEGHRVPVGGLDRDGAAAAGNGARERNRARSRGAHGGAGRGADVDAAVLSRRVRVVSEDEGS
jgi:hypothetical protein